MIGLSWRTSTTSSTEMIFRGFFWLCSSHSISLRRTEAKKYPNSVPIPWLKASLTQLGLEVYSHNFTLNYPLSKDNANYTGENVYAILRAPRASSTEALVLSVPYRSPNSPEHGTDTSIAVLLGTAKFFRKQYYWAKDIIFLVTQHEQLGMQAWLEAYHQKSCGDGILVTILYNS